MLSITFCLSFQHNPTNSAQDHTFHCMLANVSFFCCFNLLEISWDDIIPLCHPLHLTPVKHDLANTSIQMGTAMGNMLAWLAMLRSAGWKRNNSKYNKRTHGHSSDKSCFWEGGVVASLRTQPPPSPRRGCTMSTMLCTFIHLSFCMLRPPPKAEGLFVSGSTSIALGLEGQSQLCASKQHK